MSLESGGHISGCYCMLMQGFKATECTITEELHKSGDTSNQDVRTKHTKLCYPALQEAKRGYNVGSCLALHWPVLRLNL